MICIGCGCDEQHACTLPGGDPCAWIHAGPRQLAGICTACVELYPPSSIEQELNHAEASISIAMSDDEDDGEPPAISFLDPSEESLESRIKGAFWEARARQVDEQIVSAVDAYDASRPRLILPGDPEFHL